MIYSTGCNDMHCYGERSIVQLPPAQLAITHSQTSSTSQLRCVEGMSLPSATRSSVVYILTTSPEKKSDISASPVP